jgi:hypothetical protein
MVRVRARGIQIFRGRLKFLGEAEGQIKKLPIFYKAWSKVFEDEESKSVIGFAKFWSEYFRRRKCQIKKRLTFYKVWWKAVEVEKLKFVVGFFKICKFEHHIICKTYKIVSS